MNKLPSKEKCMFGIDSMMEPKMTVYATIFLKKRIDEKFINYCKRPEQRAENI